MISLRTFRSLRHRNFRIFYLGQLVSLNGTWMQSLAQSWLMYRLTGSGLMLGLTGTLTLVPNLVLGIYGGWLADRFPRQRLLIIVQTLAMLQAFTMGMLTVGHWIQPWHILLLALTLGVVQAIETPVRQSFISQLVIREDLPNAIALNSSMFHLARFFGPAIAGGLVALIGEGPVFIINGLTFIAVLISLFALQFPEISTKNVHQQGISGIWSGFHFAWQHKLVRPLLAMVATVSLFGAANSVLLPLFVGKVFKHGPESLGVFMGMMGAGSLIAALTLANRRDFQLLERRIGMAAVAAGLGLLLFALNKSYPFALAILLIMGFSTTTVYASSNALIQLSVPDDLRGRTMALFTICLHGMISIGQLLVGSSADKLGAPMIAAISGGILMLLALALAVALYRVEHHSGSEGNRI